MVCFPHINADQIKSAFFNFKGELEVLFKDSHVVTKQLGPLTDEQLAAMERRINFAIMHGQGYRLTRLPNKTGYECEAPSGEIYTMGEESCDCQHFSFNNDEPCKHLLYRDALVETFSYCFNKGPKPATVSEIIPEFKLLRAISVPHQ